MRLIDADRLKRVLIAFFTGAHLELPHISKVIDFLDNAPTIDAEPVRHGRWEYPDYYDYGDVCSYCGFDSGEIVGENQLKLLKYCPHCGAKMRGAEDE